MNMSFPSFRAGLLFFAVMVLGKVNAQSEVRQIETYFQKGIASAEHSIDSILYYAEAINSIKRTPDRFMLVAWRE